MPYTQRPSGSKRRMILGTVLATLVLSVAGWAGIAYGAAGGNMVLGANNSAGATETLLHSTVSGDKATLAVYNDNATASTPRNDALRVFLSDVGGAGVSVFAGSGTFSTTSVKDTGVRSRATGVAIQADAVGSGAVALQVNGPALFSRSGSVTITFPKKTATVTGVDLTSASLVLATVQNNVKVFVRAAVPTPGTPGSFKIHLNKAPGTSGAPLTATVAWFVVN